MKRERALQRIKVDYQSKYDVVVFGGGSAGMCAAAQAAKSGAQTLLVEKGASLGGTTTNGAVNYPGLFHAWGKQVISGVGWDIVSKSVELSNGRMPDFSVIPKSHHLHQVRINIPIYVALCDETMLNAGVHVLFHTLIVSIEDKSNDESKKITICTKEGLKEIESKVVIDCTGDANASALAGLELMSSEEKQPATYSCEMTGYDMKTLDFDEINSNFKKWVESGKGNYIDSSWVTDRPDVRRWLASGGMNANHIPHYDAFSSFGKSQLELEGRATILRMYRFLKTQKGLDDLKINFLGTECGVRETRKIIGEKCVTSEEYVSGKVWDDSLCHSFYPLDVHNLKKTGLKLVQMKEGIVPTVPLGALMPKGTTNHLVAGRCVSSDQLANGAMRVQASCMAMGQVAGATAALATRDKKEIRQLEIKSIKNELIKHNAIVP